MSTIKEATSADNADNLLELKLNFENYLGDIYIPIANIIFPYEDMSTPFDSAFFDYLAEDIKTFEEKIANLKLLEKADGAPNFINASFEELLDTPVDQGADAARNVSANTNAGEVNSQANDLSTDNGSGGSSGTYHLYDVTTSKPISVSLDSTATPGTSTNSTTQYYVVNASRASGGSDEGFARFASFDADVAAAKTVGDHRSLLDNFPRLGLIFNGISESSEGPFNKPALNSDGSPVPFSLRFADITPYANGSFDFVATSDKPQVIHYFFQLLDAQGNPTIGDVYISEIQNQFYSQRLTYDSNLDISTFSISGSLLDGNAAAPGTTLSISAIEHEFDSNNVFDAINGTLTLNDVSAIFNDDKFVVNSDGAFTFSGSAPGMFTGGFLSDLDFIVNDGHGNEVQAVASFFLQSIAGDPKGGGGGKIIEIPPVVFDFAGDGIHLVSSQNSSVTLGSLLGTDNTDKVGWIGNDDGILMYNPKGLGELSSLGQIAFVSYMPGAKTDLEGLKAFDSNHDNVLDVQDKSFNDFGVLFADGKYETLAQLGIISVSLESDHQLQTQGDNTIYGQSSYQTSSGKVLAVADVGLGISPQVSSPVQEQTQQVVQEVVQLV